MTESELTNKLRREFHAALAMHALLLADGPEHSSEQDPQGHKAKARTAFEIADAMIETGGPIE